MATFPSSPSFETCFARSLRRSFVSCGMVSRMTFPSLLGVMPTSDSMMARSMSGRAPMSNGWICSVWASGVLTPAMVFSGVSAP